MSCNLISKDALDKTIPVKPPITNIIKNPQLHREAGVKDLELPYIEHNHLKTLTPVGNAITIVEEVK